MKPEPARSRPNGTTNKPIQALVRVGLVISPLFLVPIALLMAHRLGWITQSRHLAFERTLILNVILYWVAATLVVVGLIHWRTLVAWVSRNRAGIAVLLVTSIISLGIAEFALRKLRPELMWRTFQGVPSTKLHHKYAANAVERGYIGNVLTTNEDGLRSRYSSDRFVEFDTRVAVLGDSFAFGLGVDAGEPAAEVMESRLRERLATDDVAVLNAGVTSYSPYLERLQFRYEVQKYSPQVTLLILDINDIGDDYQYERRNMSGDHDSPVFDVPEVTGRPLSERLVLIRAAEPILELLRLPFTLLAEVRPASENDYDYYAFEVTIDGKTEKNRFFVLRHPLSSTRPFFERSMSYIREIARETKAAGSEFVLVVSPRYFHWSEHECPENWESFAYSDDEPFAFEYLHFFDAVVGQEDFRIVSLLPVFEAAAEFPLVFSHDPHWNAAGHRLVGEALADYLIEEGLVPAKDQ